MQRIMLFLLVLFLTVGFSSAARAASIVPELLSVAPDTGSNDGPVTIVFTGNTWVPHTARLYSGADSYQGSIEGVSFNLDYTESYIIVTFDITGAPDGLYDVEFEMYPEPAVFTGVFTVTDASQAGLGLFATWPDKGFSNQVVPATIYGVNFADGAVVKLTKSGQPDIVGATIFVNLNTLRSTFDLNNRQSGTWNVIVTNPDGSTATLPDRFLVRDGTLTIYRISPDTGGDTGIWTARISGSAIVEGATVKLVMGGQPDIVADHVFFVNTSSVYVSFDLKGKAHGVWDVVVINPDGNFGVLPSAFTIGAGIKPTVTIDIVGQPDIRVNREYGYRILVYSSGNEDAIGRPALWGLPESAQWSVDIPETLPGGKEPVFDTMGSAGNGRMILLPLSLVSRTKPLLIKLRVKVLSGGTFALHAIWDERSPE